MCKPHTFPDVKDSITRETANIHHAMLRLAVFFTVFRMQCVSASDSTHVKNMDNYYN